MLLKEANCTLQHNSEDYLRVVHLGKIDEQMREEACLTVI